MKTKKPDIYRGSVWKVVERAGGVAALSKEESVTRQNIYYWLHKGFMPASWALRFEEKYQVPRGELIDPALRGFLEGRPADGLEDLV